MRERLFIVTGATGFVGSAITESLRVSGQTVISVSRSAQAPDSCSSIGLKDLRLIDTRGYQSVVFMHLAGETSAQRWENEQDELSRSHEAYLSTVMRFAKLASRTCQVRFVNASTATVVGSAQGVVSNRTQVKPEISYDSWKLRQEALVCQGARDLGAQSVSLRLPNIYGRPQNHPSGGRGFVTKAIKEALQGVPLTCFLGEPLIRDYLHVDDAARAFILSSDPSIRLAKSEFIGTGVGTSARELMEVIADSVFEVMRFRPEVREVDPPLTLTDLDKRSVVIDSEPFQEATGWVPRVNVREGIRLMVEQVHRQSTT